MSNVKARQSDGLGDLRTPTTGLHPPRGRAVTPVERAGVVAAQRGAGDGRHARPETPASDPPQNAEVQIEAAERALGAGVGFGHHFGFIDPRARTVLEDDLTADDGQMEYDLTADDGQLNV